MHLMIFKKFSAVVLLKILLAFISGCVVADCCLPNLGAFPNSGSQNEKTDETYKAQIPQVMTSARPMDQLADLLQGIYAKAVTYEDPFWTWSGDIGPRDGWIGSYPIDRTFIMPFELNSPEAPEFGTAFVEVLVNAYNQQADGPRFEVRTSRWGYHLVPVQVRDAIGQYRKVIPILDLHIDVAEEKRTASQHFHSVCDALTELSGIKIVLSGSSVVDYYFGANGIIPPKFMSDEENLDRVSFIWGAKNMKARDAVISLLQNSATTFSWKFLCQPLEKSCVFGLTAINEFIDGFDDKPPIAPSHGLPARRPITFDRNQVHTQK